MKQILVTIPDNKIELFVELLKSISFVKSFREEENVIPDEHQQMVRERVLKYGDNTDNYIDWDKIEQHLMK